MWIIFENSLYKYLNDKFNYIDTEGIEKGSSVRRIYKSKNKYIYAIMYLYKEKGEFTLFKYDDKKWKKIADGLNDEDGFYEDSKGRVWFTDKDANIVMIDNEKKEKYKYMFYKKEEKTSCQDCKKLCFHEGFNGKIWIWNNSGKAYCMCKPIEIMCYYNNKMSYIPVSGYSMKTLGEIMELEPGILLISSYYEENRIRSFEVDEKNNEISIKQITGNIPFEKARIRCYFRENPDKSWIFIEGERGEKFPFRGQLWLFENKKFTLIKDGVCLIDMQWNTPGFFTPFMQDRNGNIWVNATGYGVFVLDKANKIRYIDWNKGLKTRAINTMLQDGNGNIFFFKQGNKDAIIQVLRADCIEQVLNREDPKYYDFYYTYGGILADSNNDFWWVTEEEGKDYLEKYDFNKVTKYYNVSSLEEYLERKDEESYYFRYFGIDNLDRKWIYFDDKEYYVFILEKPDVMPRPYVMDDIYASISEKESGEFNIKINKDQHCVYFKDNTVSYTTFYHDNIKYYCNKKWEMLKLEKVTNYSHVFEQSFFINSDGFLTMNSKLSNKPDKSYINRNGKWEAAADFYAYPGDAKVREIKSGLKAKTSIEDISQAYELTPGEFIFISEKYGLLYFENDKLYTFKNYPDTHGDEKRTSNALLAKDGSIWINKYYEWIVIKKENLDKIKEPFNLKTTVKDLEIEKDKEEPGDLELKVKKAGPVLSKQEVNAKLEEYYGMLKNGDDKEKVKAEQGFKELGKESKEYLLKKLEGNNDEKLKWRIEAIITQIN